MLKQKLADDLKAAMKSGDDFTVGVLRLASAAIYNKEIAKRGGGSAAELTEEEIIDVLKSEAKKRKEAVTLFEKGGRKDLADRERREGGLISRYLPAEMEAAAVRAKIDEIIGKTGIKEFGPAMKEVMKELRGKADAAAVAEILKRKLAG